jgi:hypothetical protein
MEMTGEYRIPAPRDRVWAALNDPAVLKACIPGCETLDMQSPTEMTAKVVAKIGPVKATFNGKVRLENMNPPESYTIAGEGQGGVAGFAKGGADVKLTPDGDGTILAYTAKAQIGGKLAQLGARLIDSTAKMMADQFFSRFSASVGEAQATATAEAAAAAEPVMPPPAEPVEAPPPATMEAMPAPPAGTIASAPPAEPGKSMPDRVAAEAAMAAAPAGGPVAAPAPAAATAGEEELRSAYAQGQAKPAPVRTIRTVPGTTTPEPPKREIPRWVFIAGGAVVLLLVVILLR